MQELIGTVVWLDDEHMNNVKQPWLYVDKNQKHRLFHHDDNNACDCEFFEKYDGLKVKVFCDLTSTDGFCLICESIEKA